MDKRGIKGLKARVRQECCISRGGQIEQWRYIRRLVLSSEHAGTQQGGSSRSESYQEF